MKYFEKLQLINRDLNKQFPNGDNPFQMMTRLLEEAGELAEQVHIFEGSGAKPDKHSGPDPIKMAKEVQDVIGCALQVADYYGIMEQVKAGIELRFQKRVDSGKFSADDLCLINDWPPKNVICVGSVVVKSNQALLIRQAEGTSLAGQWSTPWGLVDAQEFPDVAAVRETLEEAGIVAAIRGLIGIQHIKWQSGVGIIFLYDYQSGDPVPDGSETDAAQFFDLTELEKLSEPIEPWTEWIVRRVLTDQFTLIPIEENNPFSPLSAYF